MHTTQTLPCCQRCGSSCVQQRRPHGSLEYLLYLLDVQPAQCQICGCRNMVYPSGVRHPVQDLNRRRDARLEVYMPVTFTGEAGDGEGVAVDLSAGGCKLCTTTAFSIGTCLRLQIHLDTEERPLAIERAVVRWERDAAVGVQFVQFQARESERLHQLLRMLLATHTRIGSLALCNSTSWTGQEEPGYTAHGSAVS